MSQFLRRLYHKLFPDRPESARLNDAGIEHATLGDFAAALKFFHQAITLNPKSIEAWSNFGACLLSMSDPDGACQAFEQAEKIGPLDPPVLDNWGTALSRLGRLSQSESKHRSALGMDPGLLSAKAHLGNTLLNMGRVAEGQDMLERAWSQAQNDPVIASMALSAALYSEHLTQKQIVAGHHRWPGATKMGRVTHEVSRDPERSLRLGYVSADFRTHSCACFLLPVIQAHNRSVVTVFAYSNARVADSVTQKCRAAADHWRDVLHLSDDELSEMINADQIDILVDCTGHTGGNRLAVFQRNPAPVQVSWLGYPSTTGLAAMDARLSDDIADPADTPEQHVDDTAHRLSSGYHSYAPLVTTPRPQARDSDERHAIVFGAFHNLSKLSPASVRLWADVLIAVPESKLMLKARGLSDPDVAARIKQRFAEEGISLERIDILPWRESYGTHFEDLNAIDVILDALPYNGTTTTCEALWMGVPVVTRCGDRTAGRAGASLLSQIGRQDWIAQTDDDYVRIAAALGRDKEQLDDLRKTLRDELKASSLGDASAFVESLEAGYRSLWRAWCGKYPG